MAISLTPIIEKVQSIFQRIDASNLETARLSGLKCLKGCGACCRAPSVYASPLECLPLASRLLQNADDSEALLDKLSDRAKTDNLCQFYRSLRDDPNQGSCSVYLHRPSTCRLFGAAALRRKDGSYTLMSCSRQKTEISFKDVLSGDELATSAQDFAMELKSIAPGSWMSEDLPINQAIHLAVEKLFEASRARED